MYDFLLAVIALTLVVGWLAVPLYLMIKVSDWALSREIDPFLVTLLNVWLLGMYLITFLQAIRYATEYFPVTP